MLLFHPGTEHMRFLNICLQERKKEKKEKGKSFVSRFNLVPGLSARLGNVHLLIRPFEQRRRPLLHAARALT